MIDIEKVKVAKSNILALKESSSGKDEFLHLFVENTASTLNLYFVGIHFIDESKENLVFYTGSGIIGDKLFKHKHKVKLVPESYYANQNSPAAYNGEIRLVDWIGFKILSYKVANDSIQEIDSEHISDQYFCSPMLPESRTELYLPLRLGKQTIGTLEMDFSVASTFSVNEVENLQFLANELARVIDEGQKSL